MRNTQPRADASAPQTGVSRGPNVAAAVPGPPRDAAGGVFLPGPRMLYAPADGDDPSYRAAISALTGGFVDYFNANSGTPSAALLATYDCVYTWVNDGYSDRVLFGNRLADFVDAGGKVILGSFSTYTSGLSMGGRIMTASYCPVVSPAGSNHFLLSAYVGDGTTSLHAGVLAYDNIWRDVLVTQGAGVVDGHYADNEIALAYRPDGRVIYVNGGGGVSLGGTGDWPQIISNACMGRPTAHAMLYAPSDQDDISFRLAISALTHGPVNYFDARSATPSASLLATYDCVHTWVDYPYSDRVTFGDNLADFVDAGGKVILGCFCTFTTVNSLGGRIITQDYSPVVSPAGTNHYSTSSYAADGHTCLHSGVVAYGGQYRDVLVAQGLAFVDGHYADGEIAQAYRPDGRVVYCNGIGGAPLAGTGDWPRLIANACDCSPAVGHRMLYAPSYIDDPGYRAAIAQQMGGTVDFFDATSATPSAALLATYDCVYTWANSVYNDRVLFGNRLADFVDLGGKVILGAFCTYTSGNSLGGRIMTADYSPVYSPGGTNHFSFSTYNGDGTTALHRGVSAYDCTIRDELATQGAGQVDGTYGDAEITVAYRPDRRVIYTNGGGGVLGGTGDWPRLIADACESGPVDGNMFASSNVGVLYSVNPTTGSGTFSANLPTVGVNGATEIEINPATGAAWLQAKDGKFFDQQFTLSGAAVTGQVANGYSFNGLEFALGKLYGTAILLGCGGSQLRILNPATGISTLVGPTGLGPISGLAFDARASALYGITSGCSGPPSLLVRIDITSGAATVIGPTSLTAGSLEFGPGGDLYAGGDNSDGGYLHRINPLTGVSHRIGNPGFDNITGIAFAPLGTVAVESAPQARLALAARPNPGRAGQVRISFSMAVSGNAELGLYDIAGRLLWHQSMTSLTPGEHSVAWNGQTTAGRSVAPGVYLLKLVSPTGTRTVRQVLLR